MDEKGKEPNDPAGKLIEVIGILIAFFLCFGLFFKIVFF